MPWPAEGLHHQHRQPEPRVRHRRVRPALADREVVRMSKHDLQARPIYHHKRESIDAHLTVVFAALAVTHHVEAPPAGPSSASSAPPAATEPSRSASAPRYLLQKNPHQTTYAPPSTRSASPEVLTDLSQVRSGHRAAS